MIISQYRFSECFGTVGFMRALIKYSNEFKLFFSQLSIILFFPFWLLETPENSRDADALYDIVFFIASVSVMNSIISI
jgi:hypothetical protein